MEDGEAIELIQRAIQRGTITHFLNLAAADLSRKEAMAKAPFAASGCTTPG